MGGSLSNGIFVSVCSCTFGGSKGGDDTGGIGFEGGSLIMGAEKEDGIEEDTDEKDELTPKFEKEISR